MTGETKPGIEGPGWERRRVAASVLRKSRCDSPLRNLPEPAQARIMELLARHSYRDVLECLARAGLKTTLVTLFRFRRWYELRRRRSEMADACDRILADIQRGNPDLVTEQLFKYGQGVWSLLALRNSDLPAWSVAQKSWLSLEREQLRERRLELREERALRLRARALKRRQAAGGKSHE